MPTTLHDLLKHDDKQKGASSGVRKLDYLIRGNRGFLGGNIYDISTVMGVHGVGYWDLIMNVIAEILINTDRRVLVFESFNTIPWFKMKVNGMKRRRVDVVKINSITDIVIFFKDANRFKSYGLMIIDSFHYFYQSNLGQLNGKALSDMVSPVTKFFQAMKCLFGQFRKVCHEFGSIMITSGQMEVFNQKIMSNESTREYFHQRILVPTISLRSSLSYFYTNRLILYRDWIIEDEEILVDDVEVSFKLLNNGKMECMPHYACLTPCPINQESMCIGWFGVDNKYRILDLENLETSINISNSLLGEREDTNNGYKTENDEDPQNTFEEVPESQC